MLPTGRLLSNRNLQVLEISSPRYSSRTALFWVANDHVFTVSLHGREKAREFSAVIPEGLVLAT